jgi:hypothetical protein
MKRSTFLAAGVAGLLLPAAVFAMARPDLNGEWKLNAAKSDFGAMPAPEKLVFKIDLKDPDFTLKQSVTTPQGENNSEQKFVIDGKEQSRNSSRGEVKFTPKWDGDNLVVDQKIQMQGNEITVHEQWSLGADGKVLTVTRNVKSPMGEMTMKMVFDKQ